MFRWPNISLPIWVLLFFIVKLRSKRGKVMAKLTFFESVWKNSTLENRILLHHLQIVVHEKLFTIAYFWVVIIYSC